MDIPRETAPDFDAEVDRRGSDCIKWDGLSAAYGRDDVLPLWIADMDFASPACVREALSERLAHPVLGYACEPADYRPSIVDWLRARHGWDVKPEWLAFVPGIVRGIAFAVDALIPPGGSIVVQPPIYPPFINIPSGKGRKVVFNPLRRTASGYEMDFDDLARKLDDPSNRVLLIANPHNPVGIVWSAETLRRVAEICAARGVTVISDEIHCDLALFGNRHVPFASVSDAAASCSITFGAPSKTFNVAGLATSYVICPDPELRRRFCGFLEAGEYEHPHLFAPLVTMAAFRHGEPWREAVVRYLEGNVDYVCDYIARHLPELCAMRPQASFLVWIDCRALDVPPENLVQWLLERARLALNDGATFGPGGAGFVRLNVGTRRAVLREAMARLFRAIRGGEAPTL